MRLVFLVALGMLGYSTICWALYLALPAVVAILILQKGSARYLAEDAPFALRALRWLAGAYAYLWLLTDVLPTAEKNPVTLEIETGGSPTAPSALLRLLYSLPAVVLVLVLSFVAGILWAVGVAFILVRERVPTGIAGFLALTLTVQLRLAAYHLSLVERYPSLQDAGLAHAAT
jgi:hypothetical protein